MVATIRLCLRDDVMYHVMDEKSLAAVWLKLESRYMSKPLMNKLYLKQRLYSLKMTEDTNLSQHIKMFNQVIDDLKRVDVKFEDENKVLMLLNSLSTSPTYENLVTTLTRGKETLELEDVTGALLPSHQRKKNINENSKGEELVIRVTMSVEEAVIRVIRKARILGQSPRGGRTSIVISVKRMGT